MRFLFMEMEIYKGYNRFRVVNDVVTHSTGLRGELLTVENDFRDLKNFIKQGKAGLEKAKVEIALKKRHGN